MQQIVGKLQRDVKAISVLNTKYTWLKKELVAEQNRSDRELVYVVLASVLTTIVTTLIIFCLFYETPPIRNPAPRIMRSLSFEKNQYHASAPLDDLNPSITRSPRKTHRREHSK